jgi:lipoprotein NlpD
MKKLRIIAMAAIAFGLAACSSTVVRESGSSVRDVRPVAAGRSTAKPGSTTIVQRGDNLYRIASSNGIAVQDLAAWNGIPVPYTIYPGQRLRLYPQADGHRTTEARKPGRAAPAVVANRPVAPRATPAAPVGPPINSGIAWRWPADGALINRYVAGEPTKQGVDIAGSSGAPVRAAGDGVVVYSGSGLVGYGELIIIKHNDAWLSAYGHNRNRLVNEGQLVKAGQQIAEIGHSGAPRDMLHFEVRYNGKPVDPLQYLPKR